MFTKITNREKILIIFIFAALAAVILQKCRADHEQTLAEDWKAKYEYQTQTTSFFKNRLGKAVAEQKTAETNSKAEIKRLSNEVFELKKKDEKHIKQIEALVRIKQTIRVDSVPVPYEVHDTIPSVDSTNYDNWVHVPQKFSLIDDNFSIAGRVLKEDVLIDSLRVPDTVSLRIAEKKVGLFKPRQTVVQVIHSNRFIQTDGIQSIILKKPKTNAWNRVIKPAIGVVAGVFIGVKVLH